MPVKINWLRLPDGPGYYAGSAIARWTVVPGSAKSWTVYRNGDPAPPEQFARTKRDGTPRKRKQAATRFWRTAEAAFKAAEEMIRKEAGR